MRALSIFLALLFSAVAWPGRAMADTIAAGAVVWGGSGGSASYTDDGSGLSVVGVEQSSRGTASLWSESLGIGVAVSGTSNGVGDYVWLDAGVVKDFGGTIYSNGGGTLPTSILLAFHIGGTMSVSAYNEGSFRPSVGSIHVKPGNLANPLAIGTDYFFRGVGGSPFDNFDLSEVVDDVFYVSVSVGLTGAFDLSLSLQANLKIIRAGFGSVDFLNTLQLTGVSIADGRTLEEAGFSVTFNAGSLPTPVPEPASLALVSVGVAGILRHLRCARRRKEQP